MRSLLQNYAIVVAGSCSHCNGIMQSLRRNYAVIASELCGRCIGTVRSLRQGLYHHNNGIAEIREISTERKTKTFIFLVKNKLFISFVRTTINNALPYGKLYSF